MIWRWSICQTRTIALGAGVPALVGLIGLTIGKLKCREAGLAPPGDRLAGIFAGHFGRPVAHHASGSASIVASSGDPFATYDPFDPLTTLRPIFCAQNPAIALCS